MTIHFFFCYIGINKPEDKQRVIEAKRQRQDERQQSISLIKAKSLDNWPMASWRALEQ